MLDPFDAADPPNLNGIDVEIVERIVAHRQEIAIPKRPAEWQGPTIFQRLGDMNARLIMHAADADAIVVRASHKFVVKMGGWEYLEDAIADGEDEAVVGLRALLRGLPRRCEVEADRSGSTGAEHGDAGTIVAVDAMAQPRIGQAIALLRRVETLPSGRQDAGILVHELVLQGWRREEDRRLALQIGQRGNVLPLVVRLAMLLQPRELLLLLLLGLASAELRLLPGPQLLRRWLHQRALLAFRIVIFAIVIAIIEEVRQIHVAELRREPRQQLLFVFHCVACHVAVVVVVALLVVVRA
mmetsp:Transcript_6816/g.18529  ORF Transcript_6816/g.18529 Transcript_6816/m.18529 type:complete len:298 (+) Transcript_6816:1410-2303(+)